MRKPTFDGEYCSEECLWLDHLDECACYRDKNGHNAKLQFKYSHPCDDFTTCRHQDCLDEWGDGDHISDARMSREENPLESIRAAMAFSSRDWSLNHRDAWIYGIVFGWGADKDSEDCYPELIEQHGWTPDTVERLKRLHKKYQAMKGDSDGK